MILNGFDIIEVCCKNKIYFHCKAGIHFAGCGSVYICKTITSHIIIISNITLSKQPTFSLWIYEALKEKGCSKFQLGGDR